MQGCLIVHTYMYPYIPKPQENININSIYPEKRFIQTVLSS